jgi:hypothetical protein
MGSLVVTILVVLVGVAVLPLIARIAQELDSSMGPAAWGILGVFASLFVSIAAFLLIG